jgi:UDP-N-acetylglucosamine 1-carboxyvinyltransferase
MTDVRHAALEPHVVELCEFLQKMGAGVSGIGSPRIRIEGVPRLHGAEHRLGGDYIEAGSWAVVGAITGGEVAIDGARAEDIEVVAAVLARMRIECGMHEGTFVVKPSKPKAARRITTGLWPAFPSDLVSLVTVLATQAEGRTLVHDWMYELRLFALEQMSGMGADMFLADAHRIIVTGPTRLRGGRVLDSRDLRSGMSLIAAGLAADGQTRVTPLETVERGYGQLIDRLRSLGAKVGKLE